MLTDQGGSERRGALAEILTLLLPSTAVGMLKRAATAEPVLEQ